jgi:hypothetical protein
MNPCLDCHALMFRLAHRIREAEGYHFIFSGEVLGQRPMSQHRQGLDLVARASGAPELLLRPLSARLLTPTKPELEGWLDRDKLLALQGRNRKPQMALAAELGLVNYPTPAGGCLLTDPGFSRRLAGLLEEFPEAGPDEIEFLKVGRHFDLGQGLKLILGRNHSENERLAELVGPEDWTLKAAAVPGPLAVLRRPGRPATPDEASLNLAGRIVLAYSDKKGQGGQVELRGPQDRLGLDLPAQDKRDFAGLIIT